MSSQDNKEFDVHFSVSGFFSKVEGKDMDEVAQKVEKWLQAKKPMLEMQLMVGVGIEVAEVVESE